MTPVHFFSPLLAACAGAASTAVFGWLLARGFFLLQSRGSSILPVAAQKPKSRPLIFAAALPGVLLAGAWAGFGPGLFLFLVWAAALFLSDKAPGWVQKRERAKRQERLAEVFPQVLGMSVQALKTGQTVPQVLQYLSRECPPPLREELGMVCAEMDLGSSAEQALSKMAERYPAFRDFQDFLESYRISRQTGANLSHLLEVQWEGLESKNRILRRMQAMTAQARLSGLMMGLLPFLLGFVFFLLDPDLMTPLFTQKAGWAILLMAALLESCGFLWIRHLLRLEF